MRWLLVHRDKMQSGLQQLVLLAATHFPSGSESPRITTSMGLLAFCWTTWARVSFRKLTYLWEHREKEKKRKGKKRKEKTMPFGVNLLRSPVLYRAAQFWEHRALAIADIEAAANALPLPLPFPLPLPLSHL